VGGRSRDEDAVGELLRSLDRDALAELVLAAAGRHDDVERAVRLAVARRSGDFAALRAEVDRAFRTRRFLDYGQSIEWARSAHPMAAELRRLADERPSAELVELLQRAVGHVVKTIMRADDSTGSIGDVAQELLDAHAGAAGAGVADPVKLAGWMFRFRFNDQDFFEPDPVRYHEALGETGLAAYRDAVARYEGDDSFAVRYARERLAIIDGDAELLVELLGGDLTRPQQFQAVADAMVELDRDDLALEWATRGIRETEGWQVAGLYKLACAIHARRREPLEVLRWRRAHHERMPSSSTYARLREAAEAVAAWDSERDAARAVLREHDPCGLVVALLSDGDDDVAWETAVRTTHAEIGSDLWLRLAESRQARHPDQALAVYKRLVDEELLTADRRAYAAAVRILKRARDAASAAGTPEEFTEVIARLRDVHRRRPTLIAMLDKAGMTS
jgi:hypothetical protein